MSVEQQWQPMYPRVAGALAEEYRALPEAEVARIVAEALPGMDLEGAEGFFDDVGRSLSRAASAAAPYVAPVVAGAASGAATGSVAGPWGALIGAGVGALTSGIQAASTPRRSPATLPAASRPPSVPGLASLAGAGGGGGAGSAVPQLLSALGSPTVQQALMAMLMGRAGARTVPTADGGAVPPAAVTSMLASLAGRASEEWEAIAPSAEASFGEGVDDGSPFARAEWLYEQVLPIQRDDEDAPWSESEAEDDEAAWLDEAYDEFEAFLDESDDEDDEGDEVDETDEGVAGLDEAWLDEDLGEPVRSW